jgi:S1-C subfamily serine protease
MKGGIEKEDEIVAIGDDEVLDPVHLRSLLGRYDAGDKVTLRLRRGDEVKSIEVELAVPPVQPEKSDAPAKTPEKQESPQ